MVLPRSNLVTLSPSNTDEFSCRGLRYRLDGDQHVIVLFAMHKTSVEMLKHHPYVISMDCTYKTNQFGLPLLDIVGFTATGTSIFLGFAFVQNEQQPTYEIVLDFLMEIYDKLDLEDPYTILTDKEEGLINAIHEVFPNTDTMICIWHVNTNLMKKALPLLRDQIAIARRDGLLLPEGATIAADLSKKDLDKELKRVADEGWEKMLKRWNYVIYAESESAFNSAWAHFQQKYDAPIFADLLAYIKDEWIDDCPAHFLRWQTRQYLHLGEAATSRTEGSHWLLKQDLYVSTKDLLAVIVNFEMVIERQYRKNMAAIASERIRRPTDLAFIYQLLGMRISHKAIHYVKVIEKLYLPPGDKKPPIPPICDCNSKDTTGYPCIHVIKRHLDENRQLSPSLFHQQWHLYKLGEAPPIDPRLLIQDPLPVRRRGRPRGARNNIRPVTQVPATQSNATMTQVPSTHILSSQSIVPSTQITDDDEPLTPFERSTQREPSGHEIIAAAVTGRGRGQSRGRGRGRGGRGTGGTQGSGDGAARGRGRGRGARGSQVTRATQPAEPEDSEDSEIPEDAEDPAEDSEDSEVAEDAEDADASESTTARPTRRSTRTRATQPGNEDWLYY